MDPRPRRAGRSRTARSAVLAALVVATGAVVPLGATAADEPPPLRCGTGVHAGEAAGWIALPQGDVFCPRIADPRSTRSHLTYLRGELRRAGGPVPGDGVQIGSEAGVFAQFDLGTRSADLLNADYVGGIPLTFRVASFSGRFRVWHQSSHLGD